MHDMTILEIRQNLAFKQIQICFDFGHGHEDLKYNNYYATLKNCKYAKFAKMQINPVKDPLKKNYGIIWEFFPTWGWGSSQFSKLL